MLQAKSFERVLVFLYLGCIIVVAAFTLNERSQWSQELWKFAPLLELAARWTWFAFLPAVMGLLLCPCILLVRLYQQRLSSLAAGMGTILFLCSLLLLIPAIQ